MPRVDKRCAVQFLCFLKGLTSAIITLQWKVVGLSGDRDQWGYCPTPHLPRPGSGLCGEEFPSLHLPCLQPLAVGSIVLAGGCLIPSVTQGERKETEEREEMGKEERTRIEIEMVNDRTAHEMT